MRGSAADLASHFEGPARGEITVVVGAAEPTSAGDTADAALGAVTELVDAGASRRVAAEVVARLTGNSRNRLYRGSL